MLYLSHEINFDQMNLFKILKLILRIIESDVVRKTLTFRNWRDKIYLSLTPHTEIFLNIPIRSS